MKLTEVPKVILKHSSIGFLLIGLLCIVPSLVAQQDDAGSSPGDIAADHPAILKHLGGQGADGISSDMVNSYVGHFRGTDTDRDGKLSTKEYIEDGRYMTVQARTGIFRASDRDKDGFVTEKEYVENRIITDEAKLIFKGLDENENGQVSSKEFQSESGYQSPAQALIVFRLFDTTGDGEIGMIELLRVWGNFAREDKGFADYSRVKAAASTSTRPSSGNFSGGFDFAGRGPSAGEMPDFLARAGIQTGDLFPNLMVQDARGNSIHLRDLAKGKHTLLVGGCLTCPRFLRSYPEIEALHRDYSTKGVDFFYVYRSLAHPENHGYVQPFTMEERLLHIREAQDRLKTKVPWISDNMSNQVKNAMGGAMANNAEFLLDPEGKIVHLQSWSDGKQLRSKLEELFGPVPKPTLAADLDLPLVSPVSRSQNRVVPKVEVPGILVPVRIQAKSQGQPFYVKLRAEVERSVLENGDGSLYLGFHVDPIHDVHWNNLVDPVKFEIKAPAGMKVTPSSGQGPKVKQETDSDPREFLVNLQGATSDRLLQLKVRYFACSDDEGWCRAVTQDYIIHLEEDAYAGRVMGRSFQPGGFGGRGGFGGPPGGGPGGGRPGGPGGGPPDPEVLFQRFDRNQDDQLEQNEVPEFLWSRLSGSDSNDDGKVTKAEMKQARGPGPRR